MTRRQENIAILGLLVLSILSDAIGDASLDTGDKMNGHLFASLSILLLLLLLAIGREVTIGQWIWLVVGYVFIRFAIFDLTYNAIADLPWYYIGSTSLYDKVMSLWGGGALLFARIIAGIGGISILIRKI
jgi:hypothetical protein